MQISYSGGLSCEDISEPLGLRFHRMVPTKSDKFSNEGNRVEFYSSMLKRITNGATKERQGE